MPAAVVDLMAVQSNDPFKILVATILSSRTRDGVTAAACRRLFKRAADPAALGDLSELQIADLIYPVGFFRDKAKYLKRLPGILIENFQGRVPDDLVSLLTLPGVGRKTANLVLAVAFGKPAICVDTHVHRIMNIWGYVRTATPLETEKVLSARLPKKYWLIINSILVAFGQNVCKPRYPRCGRCIINDLCPKIGVDPA